MPQRQEENSLYESEMLPKKRRAKPSSSIKLKQLPGMYFIYQSLIYTDLFRTKNNF